MAVDMDGVNLLDFIKEGFAFETLVFCGKEMAFVNLPLFDNRTAFSYLSVLLSDFFFGAYPLPYFIKENTSGGYLYVRLREQLSLAENQVDMVVGLAFVVVKSRYTFHIVPSVKFLCETIYLVCLDKTEIISKVNEEQRKLLEKIQVVLEMC